MLATASREFHPLGDTDYATPPGEILRELLEERGLTQRDLARRTGLSPKHVNRLIQGVVPLSADIAQRLEHVTGTAARLWNTLEASYRSDLERIRSQRDLAACASWLTGMPVRALVNRGVLPKEPKDKASRVEQMLSFFGVASVEAWEDVYGEMACAFRQSKTFKPNPGAVATWLRLGEIAAQEVRCAPFDRTGLRAAIPVLRALTLEPQQVFEPQMKDICAANGVVVVFVEEVTGARASGVTRWLTPAKALIQLSLRYRTDDHLWFTFFHEIDHVLRQSKNEILIEGGPVAAEDPREAQADQFARRTLIPPTAEAELSRLQSHAAVCEFAARIGVAPGVVVGRLQHDGHWAQSRGNDLKKRVLLSDVSADAA